MECGEARVCKRDMLDKTSISCETSSNFDTLTRWAMRSFAASPIDTAKLETPEETWFSIKTSISCETVLTFARLKIDVDVSPEASAKVHTLATEVALCHNFATSRSPDNAIRTKTRNTTRLRCCACHAKCSWTRPKCCACHEQCNSCSENVAKVLLLPHKTTLNLDTLPNTSTCREVHARHAKRSDVTLETSRHDPSCKTSNRHSHTAITRAVADSCGRLDTVQRTPLHPQTPEATRNPCCSFGTTQF